MKAEYSVYEVLDTIVTDDEGLETEELILATLLDADLATQEHPADMAVELGVANSASQTFFVEWVRLEVD